MYSYREIIYSKMTSNNMFMPIKFNTTIQLTPKELNKNFEQTILNKLKKNLENICSKHGYIKNNSIKIIRRSAGYFKEYHFNGYIAYDLACIAEICNPPQDSIIKCRVKAKNSLGVMAEGIYDDNVVLDITVPKITSGIQSEINIESLNIGDEINVQVCGKKIMLYDTKISIIGKAIKDKDDNIVVVENNEDDDTLPPPDDDIDTEDIIAESEILGDEEEEDEDTDNLKKIDIVEDTNRAGGDIGVDIEDDDELDDEDDEDELEDLDDFDEEEFEDFDDFDEVDFADD
jgi:hypothetical protein